MIDLSREGETLGYVCPLEGLHHTSIEPQPNEVSLLLAIKAEVARQGLPERIKLKIDTIDKSRVDKDVWRALSDGH